MAMNQYWSYFKKTNGNVIIFIGEKPEENEIQINGKPSFFDAVQFSEQQSPSTMNSPYQFIPLARSINETYRFYDPHLSKAIQFLFNGHSLQLIENGQSLTLENVYNVFKHFLVKKGNRVLFLTEPPKDKISLKPKDQIQLKCKTKEL
jgi:hypothetical protein